MKCRLLVKSNQGGEVGIRNRDGGLMFGSLTGGCDEARVVSFSIRGVGLGLHPFFFIYKCNQLNFTKMKKAIRIEKTRMLHAQAVATKGFNSHQAIQLRIKLNNLLNA